MTPEERKEAIRSTLRAAFGPKFTERDLEIAAEITEKMGQIENPLLLMQLSRQFTYAAEQALQ